MNEKSLALIELCEFKNGLWKGKKPPYIHVGVIRNTNFAADGGLDDSDIAYLDVEAKQFATRKLRPGDIILEKSGGGPKQAVGRVVLFEKPEGDFSFSNFTSLIRVRDPQVLDPSFLHKALYWHYCAGSTEPMQRRSTGIRNLVFDEYKRLPIPVPSLTKQRRIVAILDEAFAGIAAAVADAEKNLANARELFESYRDGIFSRKGDGWVDKRLDALVGIKHGFAFKSEHFSDEGDYVLLTPGNFYEEGGYRDRGEKQKFYDGEIPDGFILDEGALLVAMTEQAAGLLGSPIIVPEGNKFLHNQRLGLVEPLPGIAWCSEFFFHAFNTRQFRKAVHDGASGVKVRHTSPKKLGCVTLAFPSNVSEQQKIAEKFKTLKLETQRLEFVIQHKLAKLAELKQSILQKAFAGELMEKAEGGELRAETQTRNPHPLDVANRKKASRPLPGGEAGKTPSRNGSERKNGMVVT